ncbi:MAG: hypothetical protein RL701_4266 [Pseudomonadota bacterium]
MLQLLTPQPARHPSPTAKVTSLSHLIFERPDLDLSEQFLTDFGLTLCERTHETALFRAAGTAPYCYRIHAAPRARFIGMGVTVETRSDLERLAKVAGAKAIVSSHHPGHGESLTLTDPSGFTVEVVHGQAPIAPLKHRAPLSFNWAGEYPRINEPQRPRLEPPEVVKLGHVVLEVADYQATCAWYTQHLGLIPSDVQLLPDGTPAVTFFRLDLGTAPADHHTLALAQGFMPRYSHSAYEVVDADAVGTGQRLLRERGWKHAWGIGRHILGSQIFDYWQDPCGDKHEHYCDGDMFTADRPIGVHSVSRGAMAQWGQPMPASFTKPALTPRALWSMLHNLRRSPDLTVDKLVTLAKLFG